VSLFFTKSLNITMRCGYLTLALPLFTGSCADHQRPEIYPA